MPMNSIISTFKVQGFFVLVIFIEIVYVVLSVVPVLPLIRVILGFPCLFIIPGLVLLLALGSNTKTSLAELSVKAFFVSTIILVLSTTIFLFLYIPILPLTFSATNFCFVITFTSISVARKVKVQLRKSSYPFVCLAFSAYVLLILFFSLFPRLFAPDETSYISSALTGISEGLIPPIGIRPHRTELIALLQGRYFWIYLLCSFVGSTGVAGYQTGFLGPSFLVMIALTSSRFSKERWMRTIIFVIICLTPCLFYFSTLTLNDLALAFYAVFAVLFFVKSFTGKGGTVSISLSYLSYSALGLAVLSLVKLNLLVLVVLWLLLIGVLLRYRLYRAKRRYKILLVIIVLPVLLYELVLDIPYVISVWVLQNEFLGALFGRFLFVSPVEQFIGWFLAPPWNPNAATVFSHGITSYLDYFYCLLSPEASNLVFAAIIVALPLLLLRSPNARKNLRQNLLSGIVLLSLGLFYLDALGSTYISDIGRLSLWIIPLSIPLAMFILLDILKNPSRRNLLPVFLGGLLLLVINLGLTIITVGGVWVGFGFEFRLWTILAVSLQFTALTVILYSHSLIQRKNYTRIRFRLVKFVAKEASSQRIVAGLLIALVMVNGVYYSSVFMRYSMLFEDHGFTTLSSTLDDYTNDDSLVFANNYIYMRPYIDEGLFRQGQLLPPPDDPAGLDVLLGAAPNDTLFLISDDDKTTWYEYANTFVRPFAYAEFLTATPLNTSKLSNLTAPVLEMNFDDFNESIVPDSSGYGNNGINHGGTVVTGYQGNAIQFDSNFQYVTINASTSLDIENEISISFFASIGTFNPNRRSYLLSKGSTSTNGSYEVYVFGTQMFFFLGDIGHLVFPIDSYTGTWHHFLFTYNGLKMELYIDGVLVAAELASGQIRVSPFDLEIGRVIPDGWHLNGCIDELKISNQYMNGSEIIDFINTNYATRIQTIPIPHGQASIFQIKSTNSTGQNTTVTDSQIHIHPNYDVSIEAQIESSYSENITILIGTDRFTRVFVSPLTAGQNNLAFLFQCNTSGLYWPHLGQVRLIVIEDHQLVYNEFLTAQNTNLMNALLLTCALVILVLFSIIPYWKSRRSEKMTRELQHQP